MRKESGQTMGTNGDPVEGLHYYFESVPMGIYLIKSSTVSYTLWADHHDTLTTDTTLRVDMVFDKGEGVDPEPVGSAVAVFRITTSVAPWWKVFPPTTRLFIAVSGTASTCTTTALHQDHT